MKILVFQKYFKIVTGVKFALLILTLIAFASSLGSFIEQDEPIKFYQENYPLEKPIFGLITSKFILNLGLDHVYRTWWFFSLLVFLVISLLSCTITRQFPIFSNSKEYFFRKKKKIFLRITFLCKIKKYFLFKRKYSFKNSKFRLLYLSKR